MGANELSTALWRERELLDLLVFKLEEEQFILTSGKTKWLQYATREVEQVMERLSSAGLARTVELAIVAGEWQIDENSTLRELVAAAPDGPWSDIFSSHLAAMTQLTNQIKELRDLNEQYLRTAIRLVQEAQADDSGSGTYDARGSAGAGGTSQIFDVTL